MSKTTYTEEEVDYLIEGIKGPIRDLVEKWRNLAEEKEDALIEEMAAELEWTLED